MKSLKWFIVAVGIAAMPKIAAAPALADGSVTSTIDGVTATSSFKNTALGTCRPCTITNSVTNTSGAAQNFDWKEPPFRAPVENGHTVTNTFTTRLRPTEQPSPLSLTPAGFTGNADFFKPGPPLDLLPLLGQAAKLTSTLIQSPGTYYV